MARARERKKSELANPGQSIRKNFVGAIKSYEVFSRAQPFDERGEVTESANLLLLLIFKGHRKGEGRVRRVGAVYRIRERFSVTIVKPFNTLDGRSDKKKEEMEGEEREERRKEGTTHSFYCLGWNPSLH